MASSLILSLVQNAFTVYTWLLLARIILSWIGPAMSLDWHHPAVRFLINVTEPVLAPARRLIPPFGGLDLSPILVFIALQFVERFVMRLLFTLFYH